MFTAQTPDYAQAIRLVSALRRAGIDAHVLDCSLGMDGAVINPCSAIQIKHANTICRKHRFNMLFTDY
jgi:hypothetical protein